MLPPAFMAAMPVGASTTARFRVASLNLRRNVVLPVPAFPVRKTFAPVLSTKCHTNSKSLLFMGKEANLSVPNIF